MNVFWIILLKVLFIQFFVGSIIIFVLFLILNRQLINLALHQLESLGFGQADEMGGQITIVTAGGLTEKTKEKIRKIVFKNFNASKGPHYVIDKAIKGGMIIKLRDQMVDYSVARRLKEGGFFK